MNMGVRNVMAVVFSLVVAFLGRAMGRPCSGAKRLVYGKRWWSRGRFRSDFDWRAVAQWPRLYHALRKHRRVCARLRATDTPLRFSVHWDEGKQAFLIDGIAVPCTISPPDLLAIGDR